jgi:hypothetical protein
MTCLVAAWKVAQARGGSLVLLRPRARLGRKLAVIGLAVAAELPYEARSPKYVWASPSLRDLEKRGCWC